MILFFMNFHCDLVPVLQREYEEFKVRINALVAKASKVPLEGWIMQDGTPWPGNNTRDHPGMIQVFLGQSGGHDAEGNELPRLVYVSREKRPGFQHHKKAGAMNALVKIQLSFSDVSYCSFPVLRANSFNCLSIFLGARLRCANECSFHAELGL